MYLYEITLLSNNVRIAEILVGVLYLYEITLLSNKWSRSRSLGRVLYLYEITLLSNLKFGFHIRVNTRKKRLRAAGSEFDSVISTSILEFAQINVNSNAPLN